MTQLPDQTTDLLRDLIARHIDTVRDGADAVVVHYAWRKTGLDDAAFAGATADLHSAGDLDIVHGDQTFLRLTPQGFEHLASPPEPEEEASEDASKTQGFVQLSRTDMRALVLDIFRLAARAGEVGLTASALAAIWGIECQRAADLRGVIDDMLRSGTLRVERGDRTVFFLN